jgi:hypothetical protein
LGRKIQFTDLYHVTLRELVRKSREKTTVLGKNDYVLTEKNLVILRRRLGKKYSCLKCGLEFQAGDKIHVMSRKNGRGWYHKECFQSMVIDLKPEAR